MVREVISCDEDHRYHAIVTDKLKKKIVFYVKCSNAGKKMSVGEEKNCKGL